MKPLGYVAFWLLITSTVTSPVKKQMVRAGDSRGCISKYYNKDLGPLEILMMPVGEKLWLRAWLGMHVSNLLHLEEVDLAEVTQEIAHAALESEREKRSLSQVVVLDSEKERKDVLPGTVVPNSYHLWLRPFLGDVRFRGELEINISCLQPTDSILLHANGHLKVNSLTIKKLSSDSTEEKYSNTKESERKERNSIQILKVVWHVKKSLCEIILQKPLVKGYQYQLNFQYFGEFSHNNRGIFIHSYTDSNASGEQSWFLGTNLQQGNSMFVFPCFEESRFKSTFEISLARPEGMISISSSPLLMTENCTDMPGWEWDHFKITPPMATSSLAFFILNPQQFFPLSASTLQGEINVRGFAPTSELAVAQEAVDALAFGIVYLERHLGVSFPVPQLNIVFMPSLPPESLRDFWGLMMFGNKFSIPSLWFYLLKQWFGHLVTPESSSDEYVVESLAHYYAYVCPMDFPDNCETDDKFMFSPDFNYMALQDVRDRMKEEEFKWRKMVFFLRMLNYSITEESFKKGIQVFLKYRSYSTFTDRDLWDAIDIQAWSDGKLDRNMTTKNVSRSWLTQEFLPLITVTRNYHNNTAEVEQKVFVRNWPYTVRGHETMVWWIPFKITTLEDLKEGGQGRLVWLKGEKEMVIEDLAEASSFIIVNENDIGMFIANYDNVNWLNLGEYLLYSAAEGNSLISPLTRAALLRNAWYLATSGHLDLTVALDMTLFLKHETDPSVWKTLTQIYFMVSWKLFGTGLEVKFDRFIGSLLIPVYESDVDGESYVTKETRALAYYVLCKAGYKPAVERATLEFEKWLLHHQEINEGVLGGVMHWSENAWECGLDHALSLLREGAPLKMRALLLSQLAGSSKHENVDRLLYMVLADPKYVFSNGEIKGVVSAASNCRIFLRFLSAHWNSIKERYESEPNMFQYILEQAPKKCKTAEGFAMVEEFYKVYQNDFGSSGSVVKHTMEITRHNIEVIYHKLSQFNETLNHYLAEEVNNNIFCNQECITTNKKCIY